MSKKKTREEKIEAEKSELTSQRTAEKSKRHKKCQKWKILRFI